LWLELAPGPSIRLAWWSPEEVEPFPGLLILASAQVHTVENEDKEAVIDALTFGHALSSQTPRDRRLKGRWKLLNFRQSSANQM
jgi:hypothetical protein